MFSIRRKFRSPQIIPASMGMWVEVTTSVILIVLGLLLLCDPHILRSHDHEKEHHLEQEQSLS